MIPRIVLEPGLVVFRICNGYWFFARLTVDDLRHNFPAVSKKCRPDRDITSPELNAVCQWVEKDLFCPYEKSYAKVIAEQE
jgi:hypothetical protein